MDRNGLLQTLDDYRRRHADEAPVADRIRALVAAHADCFDRSCRPGHVTASAWVTSPDRDRHLLVHHRKLNKWLQPGGHADGDADVAAVALREAREETGVVAIRLADPAPLDLDVHDIPARRDHSGAVVEDAHEHHDIRFLCIADPRDPIVVSDESNDVRWFATAELPSVTTEPSVLRLLDKAVARHTVREER